MSPAGAWEADLRAAVKIANVPTLLMVVVQSTGDRSWLGERYRPARTKGLSDDDTGQLPPEVQDEIRAAALDAMLGWRDGRPVAIEHPEHDLLLEMMRLYVAEPVPDVYAAMMAHELGVQAASHVEPAAEIEVPEGFGVLVIGAGVSGLCAGVSLSRAGIPFTIVERNATVGGTWLANRYPGCGVDTPNHLYSFSFAPNDWSHYFAQRDELYTYLERIADEHDLRPRIRFETEVVAATYDEGTQEWAVEVETSEGSRETLHASVVVSAVGAFNKPKLPSIRGLDRFAGPAPHTAAWPEAGIELEGRRVAVIGNGASAMQLVPAVAGTAERVTVFQRSPQWAAPFEKFHTPVPEPVRMLMRDVPLYRAWYRLRQAWIFNDRIYDALHRDPDWPHPERSINEVNDKHREFFTRYILSELGDRQDLADAVVPDYPPFGKRMLLDNRWFRTLTRKDVELVTDPVAEIRADGVVTADGSEHKADVLVLATGFDVVRFLAPMEIRGRSGATLSETWDGDNARAYLGLAMPDFPNFFCLYGPNSQTGHGGSVIFIIEIQMHYVMSVLRQMLAAGIGSVECRQEVHDEYNERVDAEHEEMVWTHPGMDTYYRNSRGRVVVNNPFRVVDYWHTTRNAALGDFRVKPAEAGVNRR